MADGDDKQDDTYLDPQELLDSMSDESGGPIVPPFAAQEAGGAQPVEPESFPLHDAWVSMGNAAHLPEGVIRLMGALGIESEEDVKRALAQLESDQAARAARSPIQAPVGELLGNAGLAYLLERGAGGALGRTGLSPAAARYAAPAAGGAAEGVVSGASQGDVGEALSGALWNSLAGVGGQAAGDLFGLLKKASSSALPQGARAAKLADNVSGETARISAQRGAPIPTPDISPKTSHGAYLDDLLRTDPAAARAVHSGEDLFAPATSGPLANRARAGMERYTPEQLSQIAAARALSKTGPARAPRAADVLPFVGSVAGAAGERAAAPLAVAGMEGSESVAEAQGPSTYDMYRGRPRDVEVEMGEATNIRDDTPVVEAPPWAPVVEAPPMRSPDDPDPDWPAVDRPREHAWEWPPVDLTQGPPSPEDWSPVSRPRQSAGEWPPLEYQVEMGDAEFAPQVEIGEARILEKPSAANNWDIQMGDAEILSIDGEPTNYEVPEASSTYEDLLSEMYPGQGPVDDATLSAMAEAAQDPVMESYPGTSEDVREMLFRWSMGETPASEDVALMEYKLSQIPGLPWATMDPRRRPQEGT